MRNVKLGRHCRRGDCNDEWSNFFNGDHKITKELRCEREEKEERGFQSKEEREKGKEVSDKRDSEEK